MPEVAQITETVNINPSLLAFKPRQVVLLCKPPAPAKKMKQNDGTNNNIKTLILNPEQKDLLFHSIAKYLERSGFSKTLKKFRSETKIQNDDLENSSFDLEEMFCKFLDMCNHVSKNFKSRKVQEFQTDGISRKDGESEGKKKKSDKSTGDKSIDSKNDEETMTDDAGPIGEKSKEKKRSKKNSNSFDQEEQVSTKVLQEPVEECKKVTDSGIDNKPKDTKKKKKNKLSSDPVVDEGKHNESDSKTPKEDVTDKENKGSKKRKRMASEEDVVQAAGENLAEESKPRKTEESKRRKTEGSEVPKIQKQSAELNSANITEEKACKEESSHVGSIESPNKSVKQINGQSNGSLKEDGEKSTMRKTIKQQNGSAEPKTVKYFQRVKVDDVVFSDERLKDNSYWAKDGAEVGYGAKAQEVLGQVRGRGFRHEKTKKKRGTYRGGQIDMQSHSVKFDYSDD